MTAAAILLAFLLQSPRALLLLGPDEAPVEQTPAKPPAPPFDFVREDTGGTSPKIVARDARGRLWLVKFGDEVQAETFSTRIVRAAGYYAEPTFLVRSGRIRLAQKLARAAEHVRVPGGHFRNGRFELMAEPGTLRDDLEWTWDRNPFTGTWQLDGLKVLVMLLSNYDNKDASSRDGSNVGVLADRNNRLIYYVNDWGRSMGDWGGAFHSTWDCKGYRDQTENFVEGVNNGVVRFRFKGKINEGFREAITIESLRRVLPLLDRITDAVVVAALRDANATAEQTACFTGALRSRVEQVRRAANGS